jgi:DNA-binding NarL/FixJ family response regulator
MAARSGVRGAAREARGDAAGDPLADARRAAADGRWREAHEALSACDQRAGLAVEDLELLATAAFLRGRTEESRQARLRAYQLHLHAGDVQRAARCAARIGLEQVGAGEVAEATGCLPVTLSACSAWAAQGHLLLEHESDSAAHAHLLIPVAYELLAVAGDPPAAAEAAARAVAGARRFADADALALALIIRGRALVRSARVPEGIAHLDEAVTLSATPAVSLPVAGLALTGAIAATDEAAALDRVHAYTAALTRWSERQQGMVAFRCRALVCRASVERRRGAWDAALDTAERACEPSLAALDPAAAAAARYQQGEVLRLRGDLLGAAAAYRRAGALGLDPQPGMALCRLAQGATAGAVATLDRALAEAEPPLRRARLLPAAVEIQLAAGARAAAAAAARELDAIARDHGTPVLEAAAHQAAAAVLLSEGNPEAALQAARQAGRVWQHCALPYEAARARLLVAQGCRLLGDDATAAFEAQTARDILAGLQAKPDLALASSLLVSPDGAPDGLTHREREVLGLLATGLTNRAIAAELHVTTRTVDTHVRHILTKLDVPTRAAATAYAHRHGLV